MHTPVFLGALTSKKNMRRQRKNIFLRGWNRSGTARVVGEYSTSVISKISKLDTVYLHAVDVEKKPGGEKSSNHTVKKIIVFSVPMGSLVSDILAGGGGGGKTITFFTV
jgi:hypothetical protein